MTISSSDNGQIGLKRQSTNGTQKATGAKIAITILQKCFV